MSKSASNPNSGSSSNKPQLSEGQLEPLFRRLNLAHTRRIYQDVADRAEKENWSYRDFLALLLAEEVYPLGKHTVDVGGEASLEIVRTVSASGSKQWV
jgi:hypothetical protein